MKKAIVALLLTAMTVASLGGCGSKDSNQSGSQNAGATNADASNSGSADASIASSSGGGGSGRNFESMVSSEPSRDWNYGGAADRFRCRAS